MIKDDESHYQSSLLSGSSTKPLLSDLLPKAGNLQASSMGVLALMEL
jgi:hypothetical protein